MKKYVVTGMSCAACQARVEKAVSAVPGVESCAVSLLTNSMGVEGTADDSAIIKAVTKAGYGARPDGGASGTDRAEGVLAAGGADFAGAGGADFAGVGGLMDSETPKLRRRLILSIAFLLPLMYVSMGHMMWDWPLPGFLRGNHIAMGLYELLLSAVIMVINQRFFISGFRSLMHRAPNMDTLVAMGSAASFGYSVYALFAMTKAEQAGNPERVEALMDEFYFESAAMILTLITVGKLLESISKGRTTNALKELMRLAPKTAAVLVDGVEKEVPVEKVKPGDLFVVRPGSSIPVDGVVTEGESAVNESALTGESIPVDKTVGDEVAAATISENGYMVCRATRVGQDTTLSQIIRMVSDAAATKAPIAKIADRVSGIFVPFVIAVAAITLVIWLLVGQTAGYALARTISVLVISCPCALGLATPVAIMVGSGVGAKNGIMFKTAVSLEETGKLQIIALDKTGTITRGEPKVRGIYPADEADLSAETGEDADRSEKLLRAAYSLERLSEHPLARAVVDYCEEKKVSAGEVTDFRALSGSGLTGTLDGEVIFGGNRELVERALAGPWQEERTLAGPGLEESRPASLGQVEKEPKSLGYVESSSDSRRENDSFGRIPEKDIRLAERLAEKGETPLFFMAGASFLGIISVADVIKEDSAEAIRELKNLGMHVVMLTGDHERTAAAIAREAGVDEVVAGVKPDGKEEVIQKLQKFGKTAMVGDGINDAPALTRADMGIAIGAGSDVAIDAADVVLMKSSLPDVAAAIRLSRATLRNIHQNLFWAFFYNMIGIPLAAGAYIHAFGWTLNPMFGAAAMSLSSFCVVTNALRLNRTGIHDSRKDSPRKNALDPGPLLAGSKSSPAGPEKQEKQKIQDDLQKNQRKEEEKKMEIRVNGMMCTHCEAHVKKELEKIDGVTEAVADHETGVVRLSTTKDVAEQDIRAAVAEAGYEYAGQAE